MVRLQESRDARGRSSKQSTLLADPRTAAERNIEKMVNAVVQEDGMGEARAFSLITLRPNNIVTSMTSRNIRQTVQPVQQDWGDKWMVSAFAHSELAAGSDAVDAGALSQQLNSILPAQNIDLASLSAQNPSAWDVPAAFRIDNELSVIKTLFSCLHYLQQPTIKRMGKNFIKGICPQKQSKYPYRSRDRENQGREVHAPPWWPPETVCTFKEPDHVDRRQRIALIVWFLRLRPSPEQLIAWNAGHGKKHRPMNTHENYQWTAWLKELAPLSIVDEATPSDDEKRGRRKKVLEYLYELGMLREQYLNDEIGERTRRTDMRAFSEYITDTNTDGSTMVQPLDHDLQKTIVRKHGTGIKRPRQSSEETSTADSPKTESVATPAEKPAKKARTAAGARPATKQALVKTKWVPRTAANPASPNAVVGLSNNSHEHKPVVRDQIQTGPVVPYGVDVHSGSSLMHPAALHYGVSMYSDDGTFGPTNQYGAAMHINNGMVGSANPYGIGLHRGNGMLDSATPRTLNTSFGPTMSDASSCDTTPFTPASPFPEVATDYQGYDQMPRSIQCHEAYSFPEPQFTSMPNTPTFAPSNFVPFNQQQPGLGQDMAGLSIDGSDHVAQQPFHGQFSQHLAHQSMHGLPLARTVPSQHVQWPGTQTPRLLSYETSSALPSAHAQHAGFATTESVPGQGASRYGTNYHPPPDAHLENNNANEHNEEDAVLNPPPPKSLNGPMDRGFTGHSGGVGDSALAPPHYTPYHY